MRRKKHVEWEFDAANLREPPPHLERCTSTQAPFGGGPRSSSHMRSSAPTPAQVTGGYLRVTWAGSSRGHCPGRAPRRTDLTGALERVGSPTSLPGFGPLDGREDPENLASCRLERASAQTDAHTHKHSPGHWRDRARACTRTHICTLARTHLHAQSL